MMQVGSGTAVAAVFQDEAAARRAMLELEDMGYHNPWLAVVEPSAHGAAGAPPGPRDNAVADASDGVLGAIGRFVSGDRSLHRSLVDHGVSQSIAARIDAAVVRGNAVVVVVVTQTEPIAQLLDDCGGDVYGVVSFGDTSQDRLTVPGQGDDLDRGTGRTR